MCMIPSVCGHANVIVAVFAQGMPAFCWASSVAPRLAAPCESHSHQPRIPMTNLQSVQGDKPLHTVSLKIKKKKKKKRGIAFQRWFFRANGGVSAACQPKWGHSSVYRHSWAQSCVWSCKFWMVAVSLKRDGWKVAIYYLCPFTYVVFSFSFLYINQFSSPVVMSTFAFSWQNLHLLSGLSLVLYRPLCSARMKSQWLSNPQGCNNFSSAFDPSPERVVSSSGAALKNCRQSGNPTISKTTQTPCAKKRDYGFHFSSRWYNQWSKGSSAQPPSLLDHWPAARLNTALLCVL